MRRPLGTAGGGKQRQIDAKRGNWVYNAPAAGMHCVHVGPPRRVLVMATKPFAARGLKLDLEEKAHETIVHCTGKINAENSEAFQKEIRDLIPESRGHADALTHRIMLDFTNVTFVDSTGLGALLGVWTAAQRKGCDLEIANLNPRVGKILETTKLDTVFRKMKDLFGGTKV